MKAHVICCNDSLEYAVLEDEKRANGKLLELKESYFERNKGIFRDRKEYEARCHWHVHTVVCEADGSPTPALAPENEVRRLLQGAEVLFAPLCRDATAWNWLDDTRAALGIVQ